MKAFFTVGLFFEATIFFVFCGASPGPPLSVKMEIGIDTPLKEIEMEIDKAVYEPQNLTGYMSHTFERRLKQEEEGDEGQVLVSVLRRISSKAKGRHVARVEVEYNKIPNLRANQRMRANQRIEDKVYALEKTLANIGENALDKVTANSELKDKVKVFTLVFKNLNNETLVRADALAEANTLEQVKKLAEVKELALALSRALDGKVEESLVLQSSGLTGGSRYFAGMTGVTVISVILVIVVIAGLNWRSQHRKSGYFADAGRLQK